MPELLDSLRGEETVLYIHRDGVGRRGYLGRLRFNPATHNIGHLCDMLRSLYGAGSYWIRTQSKTGSGYGPGSAMIDLDDPTPMTPPVAAAPMPSAAVPLAPQVQILPAQAAVDVNSQLLFSLLKELVSKMGSGGLDINQLSGAIQSALTSQQASVQALTSARDPANQAFASAREILKMTRELGGQVASGGTDDMMPMMMMMMMMNGGGGNMSQMMPMMMMMNQGQGGGNMSQMMPMMMMMMNQNNGPPRPGPGPQAPRSPNSHAEMMQMMQMMQGKSEASPWGPIGAPQASPPQASPPQASPPQASPPQASPPRAANTLHLAGYDNGALDLGAGGMDLAAMGAMAGLSPEDMRLGLETLTPEERASFLVLAKGVQG